VRRVILVAMAAVGQAACGSGAGGHSATKVSEVTTTTERKSSPTAAEVAFDGDLVAVDSADKTAAASLTTLHASQATGTAYSQTQVVSSIAPVSAALTTAVNALTTLIPGLPANMNSQAQALSSTMSNALNVYQLATSTVQEEASLPSMSASVESALAASTIVDLQADVSEQGALVIDAERPYVAAMQGDYSTSS